MHSKSKKQYEIDKKLSKPDAIKEKHLKTILRAKNDPKKSATLNDTSRAEEGKAPGDPLRSWSTILFIIIVFGALGSEWNLFITNIFKLGPAITLLIISMLAIGYNSSKLFKLSRKQSITISIESGIQNATVCITIGNLVLNSKTGISLLSLPSGLYGILMYIFCLPFVVWFIKSKTN